MSTFFLNTVQVYHCSGKVQTKSSTTLLEKSRVSYFLTGKVLSYFSHNDSTNEVYYLQLTHSL